MEMTEICKLDLAKEIVSALFPLADCGIFNSRNLVGDEMCNIYDDGELCIDICPGWEYLEVFGLSHEDFEKLKAFYNELREASNGK